MEPFTTTPSRGWTNSPNARPVDDDDEEDDEEDDEDEDEETSVY